MSDLHLGMKDCKPKRILEFLDTIDTDLLILNGDIIDVDALRRGSKWKGKHMKVLIKLLDMSRHTEIIYIRGNHDNDVKDLYNSILGNIKFMSIYIRLALKSISCSMVIRLMLQPNTNGLVRLVPLAMTSPFVLIRGTTDIENSQANHTTVSLKFLKRTLRKPYHSLMTLRRMLVIMPRPFIVMALSAVIYISPPLRLSMVWNTITQVIGWRTSPLLFLLRIINGNLLLWNNILL